MAYCATSDILDYGGFPSTTVASDITKITSLIPRAQAWIDAFTGTTFEYTATDGGTTRYFDTFHDVADDGVTLVLDKDLAAIASISVGSDTVASSNYTTLPRSDKPYYAIRLKDNSTNSWDIETSDGDWENAIAIKGEWVYSTAAPADVQHACIRLTWFMYKQRESSADIDRPLLTGDGMTIMPSKLPADVQAILSRYKKKRFA